MGIHIKLESPGINGEGTKICHNFQIVTTDVFIVQEIIRPRTVQQHSNGKPQPLTVLLVVQVLQHTKMHLTHHIHLHIPTHSHQPAINTVSLLYMYKHQLLTVTLRIFNQTYTKLLPHHLHKITTAPTVIQTNNKCTHHQHNHLIHSFHNHSTHRFHHHISHNTHLLAVHLQIVLDMECNEMERQKEERKRMKEEREQRKEDRKQVEKCKNQQRSRINKAFEKIPRFDGTNPSYCFNWLEQTEALVNEHQGRIYREELLRNCGTSVSKTIHALPQGATNQHIKDAVLRNHSNLRTVSQRSNAYHQLHQKPDEALQTYNMRYASFFNLAYPELELDNPLSRMHCIHYASSLYSKLGDEMTGRFHQDLPENLQMAFEKATNFEPQIITKQSINNRKVHKVNHIDITCGEDEVEINEAHVRNPNYKGKNYDPNYQQNRTKTINNTTPNTAPSHHNTGNQGYRYYDIRHSTETESSWKTTQQKENMQIPSTNSTPKGWKLMRQQ